MKLKCYVCWRDDHWGKGPALTDHVSLDDHRVIQFAFAHVTVQWSGWNLWPQTVQDGHVKKIQTDINKSVKYRWSIFDSLVEYFDLYQCEGPEECFGPAPSLATVFTWWRKVESETPKPDGRVAPVLCVPHASMFLEVLGRESEPWVPGQGCPVVAE